MANLIDRIKYTPERQEPQQEEIERLLRAKSGKAGGLTGPRASQLGERAVQAQATQALEQQQRAGQIQDIGISQAETAQQQQLEQARAGQLQQLELTEQQLDSEIDNLLENARQSNETLELREDAAQIEQLGHMLALRDQQYLADLNRTGNTSRLMDDISFKEESARIALGDNLQSALDDMEFKSFYAENEREFEKELARLDGRNAIKMMEAAIEDAKARAKWEGISTMFGGAVKYAALPDEKEKTTTSGSGSTT